VDLPESLSFGWQGHELVAAVTSTRRMEQIAVWHPSAARILVRKVKVPPGMIVAVGQYG
jgi:hypothetical protein